MHLGLILAKVIVFSCSAGSELAQIILFQLSTNGLKTNLMTVAAVLDLHVTGVVGDLVPSPRIFLAGGPL